MYKCCFLSYTSIPEDELDIAVHIALACKKGFGHNIKEPYLLNLAERYYLTVLFLMPEMEKEHDECSVISSIVHNEYVSKELKKVRKWLRKGVNNIFLKSLFSKLFLTIQIRTSINDIVVYDTNESWSKINNIKSEANVVFFEIPSILNRFQNLHMIDIVVGQSEFKIKITAYGENEDICNKQGKPINNCICNHGSRESMIMPGVLYVLYFVAILSVMHLLADRIIFWYDANEEELLRYTDWTVNTVTAVLTMATFALNYPFFAFEEYRMVFSNSEYLYKGIWSYCNLVEYGTFRKFGMKYIYFSKKHMTDEEFKVFRKKIIPYDYDSIAVPYRKDYMKIAENLIFATRKDR